MFKQSAKSAFKSVKRSRVEPELTFDDAEDHTYHDYMLVTPSVRHEQGRRIIFRRRLSQQSITIKCGSLIATKVKREALLRAIPQLDSHPTARSIKTLIISSNVLTKTSILNSGTLACFGSICEALYVKSASLKRFKERDLRSAMILAAGLQANGVAMVCKHLLRDAHATATVDTSEEASSCDAEQSSSDQSDGYDIL